MAAQHVDPDQVQRAAAALLKHIQEQESRNPRQQLIEEEETISLIVTLKQIPTERKAKPIQIPLAHSLAPENQEICVFIKDSEHELKKALLEIAGVSKVINLSKLRKNYKTFEAKRKLSDSYDLFITDDRVVTFMPALLGKAFYEKKRNPIPLSLKEQGAAERIQKAQSSSWMFLTTGACLNIKIGRSSFTAAQVAENVMEALPKIVERVPKKWANIQALHIKSTSSVSLPIYNSLPDANVVATANVQVEKRKMPQSERPAAASGTPKKARKDSQKEEHTATPAAAAPSSTAKRVSTPVGKSGTPKRVAVTGK